MRYLSTRGQDAPCTSANCIVKGLASDGGLYVPESIPVLSPDELKAVASGSYIDSANLILSKFLTDFTSDELSECVKGAYGSGGFDSANPAPLHKASDGVYYLELWHGPTCAFKDMALQLTPRLMVKSLKKTGTDKKTMVVVATSGDTGKAALEGFCDVDGTAIAVFYPKGGVSEVQERQMVSQKGGNISVAGIIGNFDDAQRSVKELFAGKVFVKKASDAGWTLSSANSINWGRLVPQIVYYVTTSLKVVENNPQSTAVDFVVPTGNFGNILAAYYAKKMGAPVGRLYCASNRNDVLTRFIKTGRYDTKREFIKTASPSMDILVSSNLERLLYEILGHKANGVKGFMSELSETGVYQVSDDMLGEINKDFCADACSDEDTFEEIRRVFDESGYLIDTHTAVASAVAHRIKVQKGSGTRGASDAGESPATPLVVVSTASPFKFSGDVLFALSGERLDGFSALTKLSELSSLPIPKQLSGLENAPILHDNVVKREEIADFVESLL